MIGYKVVTRLNDNVITSFRSTCRCFYYRQGEPTIRPTANYYGPMAVFDTLVNAINFLSRYEEENREIWLCSYTKSKESFLRLGAEYKSTSFPQGTKFADIVTLLMKII